MEFNENREGSNLPDEIFMCRSVLKALFIKMNTEQKFDTISRWGVNSKSLDHEEAPILHLAIEFGLLHLVKFLIQNEVSASATDNQGNSALHALSKSDNKYVIAIVKSMWRKSRQNWMPVNKKNQSPIGDSLYHKNVLFTQELLDELNPEDFKEQKVLQIPIQQHFHQGLEMLISWQNQRKASPSILVCGTLKNPFQEAIRARNVTAFDFLLSNQDLFDNPEQKPETWIPLLAQRGGLKSISTALNRLKANDKKRYIKEVCSLLKSDKKDQEEGKAPSTTQDKNQDQNKGNDKMQISEQREMSINDQIKSQEIEPIQSRTNIMKEGVALPEKDDNKEGPQKEGIEKAIENLNKSKEVIEEEKVKSEGKNKEKTPLEAFFKYRDNPRRAEYLREHLLLAIDLGMSEEALMFLQFSEKLFSDHCKEYWQQIIFYSHQTDLVASPNHPDHSKTTPLLESIMKKFVKVTQKLIDLERDKFMQASDMATNEEVRAHHASNIAYPGQLKHCLGPGNPSDQILRRYFHYLVQGKPLAKRMATLVQSDQVTFLKLHRQWAVQVFDHSALHEVTNAIATLTIAEKRRIVCSYGNVLQSAVSTQKRLIIGELLHQEYLCHKKDEDEQEGKNECILCIQKQLTHDYDISYVIDTLDSFFPKTNVAKWCNFIFFHLVFVLLGASLILLDIYLDMQLTEDFYNHTLIATNETDQTKFELAFQISWGSQLLPLITSIPIWIWKLTELEQFSSKCIRRVSSTTQQEDMEMRPRPPNERTQLMKHESTATSNKEHMLTSKWKTTIEVLYLALPPFAACLAFTVCILLKKQTLKLGIICASNFFTGAVILCLSLARLINRWQFIFSQDHQKSTLRNQLQVIERQHALATIGESCLEAIVQLSLQLWLLSQEDFASDFDEVFTWSAIRTLRSVISVWKPDPFRNQLIFKLFMSCLSLIFSVCKSYRLLKNQSMRIYHLSFVFLSLNFQLWARMSVIFAWCMYMMDCSPELRVGGVGIFLVLNILFAGLVRVANVDHNAERPPLTYQNILAYFLELMASSMVLVRIPKAKQDNEIVSENTLALQSWYFFLSFVTNIMWIIIIQCCAKISLCWTFVEISVLFGMAGVFQILYYTVFGHPWRYISQIKFKNTFSKIKMAFLCCGNTSEEKKEKKS